LVARQEGHPACKKLPFSLSISLSVLTAIFQVNLGYPVFVEAKDDRGGGDNWNYKSCRAPVKSLPSTNQHPVFLQAGCPSYRPNKSVKALKGKPLPSSSVPIKLANPRSPEKHLLKCREKQQ